MEIFSQEILNITQGTGGLAFIFIILLIWSLVWKGLALWQAARLSHKWWFIAILVISSLGILEIIYLFVVSSKYTVESKEVKSPGPKKSAQ